MQLVQKLNKPIPGYWDGGLKQVFHWRTECGGGIDSRRKFVRVGSWDANQWFHVAEGKTEKQTLGNARRHLNALATKSGLTCEFWYID